MDADHSATGVAGAAVTLTLAAPGAGLRHHLTRLAIERHAAAALTAGATPTLITTNLLGSLAFSILVEAAVAGSVYEKIIDPVRPMMSIAPEHGNHHPRRGRHFRDLAHHRIVLRRPKTSR